MFGDAGASITMTNASIQSCSAFSGGGIQVSAATLEIANLTATDCSTGLGGFGGVVASIGSFTTVHTGTSAVAGCYSIVRSGVRCPVMLSQLLYMGAPHTALEVLSTPLATVLPAQRLFSGTRRRRRCPTRSSRRMPVWSSSQHPRSLQAAPCT